MNTPKPSDRPAGADRQDRPSEPEPWHAADEKPRQRRRGGAPIGTHSLTGGGASVGMPAAPKAEAERSSPRDMPPGAEEPDLLAEPRAGAGDLLGRKR